MVENQGENDDVADAWDYGEEGGESEDEKVDDPTCEWLNDEIPPDDPESSPTVESKQDPMESSKISDSVNNVPRADADTEPKDLTTMVLAIQLLSTDFLEGRLSNSKSQSMQLSHKQKNTPFHLFTGWCSADFEHFDSGHWSSHGRRGYGSDS